MAINYEADIHLTDAEGGTWDETIKFQAANDTAAEAHVCEHAEEWFGEGEEIGTGKVVPGAVEARFELRDLDADEEVMELTITPEHDNDSGSVYREQKKAAI